MHCSLLSARECGVLYNDVIGSGWSFSTAASDDGSLQLLFLKAFPPYGSLSNSLKKELCCHMERRMFCLQMYLNPLLLLQRGGLRLTARSAGLIGSWRKTAESPLLFSAVHAGNVASSGPLVLLTWGGGWFRVVIRVMGTDSVCVWGAWGWPRGDRYEDILHYGDQMSPNLI